MDASAVKPSPPSYLYVSGGWALGVASNPFSPQTIPESGQGIDAEPLIAVTGAFEASRIFEVESKLILGNFARLVEFPAEIQTSFGVGDTIAAVRRALIADMTVRYWPGASRTGLAPTFNTGFIFDAQADPATGQVDDAASYLLGGLTLQACTPDSSQMRLELLCGLSEILTGKDAFDFSRGHHLRIRPRVEYLIHGGFLGGHNLLAGIWGDLGILKGDRDAVTVFLAVPLTGTSGARP